VTGRQAPAGAEAVGTDAATATAPMIQVVRGNPAPEDIAAIVTVLAAASGGGEQPTPGPRLAGWGSRGPWTRPAHPRGPGWWRSAARMR